MSNEMKKNRMTKYPPSVSKTLWCDINNFFFHTPPEKTLVKYHSPEERKAYSERIMQRIRLEVDSYSVLNVHQIGVDVPVQFIFEELLQWNGDSTCWPNQLARVERINNRLEEMEILMFGVKHFPFGILSPLFRLNAIRFQHTPASSDYDNARYLLYRCSGGYPIGIFSVFVRSSIPNENETGQSQLFMAVGFDFYGRKSRHKFKPVQMIWEFIHNRVTSNTLNRLKQLCEWRFEKIQEGEKL
jgi:hypothetical protein